MLSGNFYSISGQQDAFITHFKGVLFCQILNPLQLNLKFKMERKVTHNMFLLKGLNQNQGNGV